MVKHTRPIEEEESPERIADYHRGEDNSIKNVMRSIKDAKGKQGIALSGVDDNDIDKIKEPPDEGTKEIKEPPPPKPSR